MFLCLLSMMNDLLLCMLVMVFLVISISSMLFIVSDMLLSFLCSI